ncbi:MAG TPA: sterol desaturase family protein [Flavisolibacter sp.]|nr:sterol desaturase family protein [Flavisolibacter sp.]
MPLKYTQILILAVVFLLQYIFEHIFPQRKEINEWKNERFNIAIGLLNLLLNFLPASTLVYLLKYLDENNIGLLHQVQLPFVAQLLITILVLDLWMYVWHRLNHNIPFLWQFHRFHHKDEKMNSTTAIRFHIIELWLSLPGKALIYFLLGAEFNTIIIYEIFFFTSVVVHHSNIYISEQADRVYRILFASPRVHRIHHSIRREETHSNYGAIFSFWDRIFKSWKPEPNGNIIFGTKE